jgi:hypothetical protein
LHTQNSIGPQGILFFTSKNMCQDIVG